VFFCANMIRLNADTCLCLHVIVSNSHKILLYKKKKSYKNRPNFICIIAVLQISRE